MPDDDDRWVGYAPIDGPPPGTACAFCRTVFPGESERGWAIAPTAAVCGQCVRRVARAAAAANDKNLDEWAAEP